MVKPPQVNWIGLGVMVILIFGAVGFFYAEPLSVTRILLGLLVFSSLFVLKSFGDRLLLALTTLFLALYTVLGMVANEIVPLFIGLALTAISVSVVEVWLLGKNDRALWLVGLVVGLVAAQLMWLLRGWPFDEKSKAIVVVITLYALNLISESGKLRQAKMIIGPAILFLAAILFVLRFARWYP